MTFLLIYLFFNFVGPEVSIAMAPSTKSHIFFYSCRINPFKTYYAYLRFIIFILGHHALVLYAVSLSLL